MSGKLYIAAAGAGKTSKIVNDALSNQKKTLILTYTIANEQQIIKRIQKINGIVPENITVSTWFSFLLRNGVRPFQGSLFNERIEGVIMVNGQSKKYVKKETKEYYSQGNKIYTDKLSECVDELNKRCGGKIFERIAKMYTYIYVDEVQDMVGYDLEVLKNLIATNCEVIMVGDPRQCTYSTHSSNKYKKYSNGKIDHFLRVECNKLDISIDNTTLNRTYRNNDEICNLANSLYPDRPATLSINKVNSDIEGVKIIEEKDIETYLKMHNAVQLRDNKRCKVIEKYPCYNFGESKGLEFESVLIYPTKPIWDWIVDNNSDLTDQSRAKLYVAITRAINTVLIVKKDGRETNIPSVCLNRVEEKRNCYQII